MRIGKPTADGDGVLRMKNVTGGAVVDDDGFAEVAADLREIFDVVALVVVAGFAVEAMADDVVDVELVEEGLSVLFVGERDLISWMTGDWETVGLKFTLDTEAVKTTTSYSSPTLRINSSTPGRLMTYTLWY